MTESIEIRLNSLLAERGAPSLATAESCTGGSVAARIVSVSGSSAYFLGGIVSYSNEVKHGVLGVPWPILEERGAVSPECARAMAAGARSVIGSDIAVSTTGIAGPAGGTPRKPVGLVYIGIATPTWLEAFEFHFDGDRARIIEQSVQHALARLLEAVTRTIDGH